MSYKIKTLIVFDTNSLRSTDAGEVAYSFFAFGRPFQVIEEFILEKNLAEDVHIAIPTWAIEELKDQKNRQYKTDIIEFQKLAKRLSGLPHIPEITLPEEEFDCAAYVGEKALAYLATKEIKLLEIQEEIANSVLRSMMVRVMKDEGKKQPFAHSGKYKDAGFKDNVVWESLMNFEEVVNYDKIIFLSRDGDYKNCDTEFREKWQRHISILKDENNVVADIQKDYDNYIKERTIHDFAQTEYFADYLKDDLNAMTLIVIEGSEYKIENYTIADTCKNVNRLPPNEDEVENLLVSSIINIHFTKSAEKVEQPVEALTLLEDDETKTIISTEYDIELR
jgi:PIN domain